MKTSAIVAAIALMSATATAATAQMTGQTGTGRFAPGNIIGSLPSTSGTGQTYVHPYYVKGPIITSVGGDPCSGGLSTGTVTTDELAIGDSGNNPDGVNVVNRNSSLNSVRLKTDYSCPTNTVSRILGRRGSDFCCRGIDSSDRVIAGRSSKFDVEGHGGKVVVGDGAKGSVKFVSSVGTNGEFDAPLVVTDSSGTTLAVLTGASGSTSWSN